MRFHELLRKELKTIPKPELLPKGYQEIGDIIILRIKPIHKDYEKEIAGVVHRLTGKKVAIWKEVKGELRIPEIKVFFGNGITTKKEYGCVFKLDITKVMYSKGNIGEKARLLKLVKDGENILDMFAGIGYFTIILAKHRKVQIHAIEKNIDSYLFLVENIFLNKLNNVVPFFGDNREIIPQLEKTKKTYDRILMGYLPSSYEFLDFALRVSANTVIHLHEVIKKNQVNDFEKQVIKKIEESGFEGDIIERRIVKSYAPHRYHMVFDIRVKRI